MSDIDEKIEVQRYGIHWTPDGIAYLHQGRAATNFLSLKAPSPFVVSGGRRNPCNHLFPGGATVPDPSHWRQFQALANDPLVVAILPVPKAEHEAGVFVMEDTNDELNLILLTLSRMSSPIQPIVRPIWHYSPSDVRRELERSNVQPLVLTQANPKYQRLLDELIDQCMYVPRRVIVTGTSDLIVRKPAQRLKTALRPGEEASMVSLPLENLGMTVLKRYARREEPLSDLPPARGRSMSDELQLATGQIWRAKRPSNSAGLVNDRQILYVNPWSDIVQYDSPSVARGRQYPKVTHEQFRKWAGRELMGELPAGEWQPWDFKDRSKNK